MSNIGKSAVYIWIMTIRRKTYGFGFQAIKALVAAGCLVSAIHGSASAQQQTEVPFDPTTAHIAPFYDATRYTKCIMKNAGQANTDAAARLVMVSCRMHAIPKKCRPSEPHLVRAGNQDCYYECQNAGYISRTFGECSFD